MQFSYEMVGVLHWLSLSLHPSFCVSLFFSFELGAPMLLLETQAEYAQLLPRLWGIFWHLYYRQLLLQAELCPQNIHILKS